jgi:predicted CoA-substrate-specific enzyme activase
MSRSAGIDIGSRTIKLIVIDNGEVVVRKKRPSTYNPMGLCDYLLEGVSYDTIVATGYGRHLFKNYRKGEVITELKAFAVGAAHIAPSCGTVLDIGGQDTKAITIDPKGGVERFEMNDKCAAGTGRFLEIMAAALGFRYEEFAQEARLASRAEPINNMCTVFAESEVISLVTQGVPRSEIALGIHKSIVSRAINILKRVSTGRTLMFAGGVALNSCVAGLLREELGVEVIIPDDPQLVGALGCALHGQRS